MNVTPTSHVGEAPPARSPRATTTATAPAPRGRLRAASGPASPRSQATNTATAKPSSQPPTTGRGSGPTRQRRRPLLIAIGAVLVLVSALASYVAFSNLSTSVTVVVTTSDVAAGDIIDAGHLGTLEIAGGQATNAVPASHVQDLVGQHAAVDLPAGALVTSSSVQPSLPVDPGMSIVGIAVSAGQLPSTGLANGDRIRVVSTPIAQGEPPIEPPLAIEAVVFAAHLDEGTGSYIVDVTVPNAIAADVAARAATGRIAIVLDSPSAGS